MFTFTSHWHSPSVCEYLWRNATSSFISHGPYIPEDEVLTESALKNGIAKLNGYYTNSWAYTASAMSLLASFIAIPTAFLIIPPTVFSSSSIGGLIFLFILLGLPILFSAPVFIILLQARELIDAARNRLKQMELLAAEYQMDSQKNSPTPIQKRLLLLTT